jgi:hypothetical protein
MNRARCHRIETIQNRDYTEDRLLVFSYDFGVTIIRHQNADAMVLASAPMRSIHPPQCPPLMIFKMADVQGANASHKRTRTMASAF